MNHMTSFAVPMIAGLGPTELLIILAVIVLLFGASKLPELARGSGRALRIFKAETKGLMDDDDSTKTPEQRQIDAQGDRAGGPVNGADGVSQQQTHPQPDAGESRPGLN